MHERQAGVEPGVLLIPWAGRPPSRSISVRPSCQQPDDMILEPWDRNPQKHAVPKAARARLRMQNLPSPLLSMMLRLCA